MKTKVKLIIMSHLSDVQEMLIHGTISEINQRINFAKWLILKYSDTNIEIDPDDEWDKFLKR